MTRCMMEPDELHLIPFRTSGGRPPLYCFPGAGGDAGIFQDMAAALREDQPVYAIDMDKLYEARSNFKIEELAEFYLQVIRSKRKQGPYNLCGYSFGGIVAYEIARLLVNDGQHVGLLALLDAPNPALLSSLPAAASAQFRNVYLTDRIKKYGRNLLRGNIRSFASDAAAFVIPRMTGFVWPLIRAVFRVTGRPMPLGFRARDPAFLAAWHSYIPRPYPGRLVLFRGQDRGPEYEIDSTMGWSSPCAIGGVDVFIIPGGHVGMMHLPYIRDIVDKLTTYLGDGAAPPPQA
jgi:thioesterase domain-containing protein